MITVDNLMFRVFCGDGNVCRYRALVPIYATACGLIMFQTIYTRLHLPLLFNVSKVCRGDEMSMLVTTLYSIMSHRATRSTTTSLGSTERIEVRGHPLPEVQQKVLHLKYKYGT